MVLILHSGQTGVERGAHHGALAAGLAVAGYMRAERRDELGPLPPDIAERLSPCTDRGHRAAASATLELATAVLLVVPDTAVAIRRRSATWILRGARAKGLPYRICDANTGIYEIGPWFETVPARDGQRCIMVTGPRATRWNAGEAVARRIVKSLAFL